MRRKRDNPFSLFSFQDIITGVSGIMIFFVLVMLVDLVTRREGGCEPCQSTEVVVADFSELESENARLEAELAELREAAQLKIVNVGERAAPEVAAKLQAEMSGREKEIAALVSQVEALRGKVAEAEGKVAEEKKKAEEAERTRKRLVARLEDLKNKKGVTLILGRGEAKTPVFVVIGRGGYEVLKPLAKTTYRKWYNFGQFEECVASEFKPLDTAAYTVVLMVRPSGMTKMQDFAERMKNLGFSCGRDPLEDDLDVDLGRPGGGS